MKKNPGEYTFAQGDALYTLSKQDHKALVEGKMHAKYGGALIAHAEEGCENLMFTRPRRKGGLPPAKAVRPLDIGAVGLIFYGDPVLTHREFLAFVFTFVVVLEASA